MKHYVQYMLLHPAENELIAIFVIQNQAIGFQIIQVYARQRIDEQVAPARFRSFGAAPADLDRILLGGFVKACENIGGSSAFQLAFVFEIEAYVHHPFRSSGFADGIILLHDALQLPFAGQLHIAADCGSFSTTRQQRKKQHGCCRNYKGFHMRK